MQDRRARSYQHGVRRVKMLHVSRWTPDRVVSYTMKTAASAVKFLLVL